MLAAPLARAQEAAPAISLYGFVKAETIYDTRQVFNLREGQFLLFPLPEDIGPDEHGDEIDRNDRDNWLQTAIQTRLGVRGTGARALGADLSGVVEGDFFGGPTNDNISLFILRHAYVQLAWARTQLLLGQYWSPLFTVPVFPGTVSFNTGAPFQPFARHPQIRLTYRLTPALEVEGTLAGQRDVFAEIGGPKLQRQAGLPMLHAHLRYGVGRSLLGIGTAAKWIRPALATDRFTAAAIQGYASYAGDTYGVAGKVTYGGDLVDHQMTGGFVAVEDGGDLEFRTLRVLAAWAEAFTTGGPFQYGIFGGYLTNLGAGEEADFIAGPSGTRYQIDGSYLASQFRVAPRVIFNAGKLRLADELELTSARYTPALEADLSPDTGHDDAHRATNLRLLFAAYYFF